MGLILGAGVKREGGGEKVFDGLELGLRLGTETGTGMVLYSLVFFIIH